MGKKKRRKVITKRFLLFSDMVLVAVMAVSLFFLIRALSNYRRDQKIYAEAAAIAGSDVAQPPLPPSPQPETAGETAEPATAEATASPSGSALSDNWELPKEKPPIDIDFSALSEKSGRVRGWLYSADTPINYPVMYYTNNDYYLTHSYDGQRSDGGSLFFDSSLDKSLTAQNLIVYGHHMKNRSMFGSLLQYQKKDYYDAHPVMYLLTPEQNYRIEIFAAWHCDSDRENFPIFFSSPSKRKLFIDEAVASSAFTSYYTYNDENTQMISLVTCSYSNYYDDAKFQVNGWLIPIG